MAEPKLLAEWFWTDRWIGSSGFLLPMEARGLYREMLTQSWRRGARLPNDHESIRRAVGCTQGEWKRCWPQVEKFWRVDGNSLVNDTQLEVWTQASTAKERASERGRKGAQARAQAFAQAQERARLKREHKPKPPSPSPSPNKEKTLITGADAPPAEWPSDPDVQTEIPKAQVGAFIKRFCELYSKHRHGAKFMVLAKKHVPLIRNLLTVYDAKRLEKMAVVLLTTDEPWVKETDRGIGILSVKASWLDNLLSEYEARHGEIQVAS